MNAMFAFAPILALLALLSVEVSAESFTAYEELAGKYEDGFDLSVTYLGKTIPGAAEPPVAQYTKDEPIEVTIDTILPAASALEVAPGVGAPSKVIFKMCFSPASSTGRKWRAFKDEFAKDNSCKTAVTIDPVDYKAGAMSVPYTLPDKTPTAEMVPRAYVRCAGQVAAEGEDQEAKFCHVANLKASIDPESTGIFMKTEVMENRPANLFTAVLICAFIGPILLAAFLVYERAYLANKKE